MNEKIEVKTDISDYKSFLKDVFSGFGTIDTLLADIGNLIAETDKWSGDSRDKCENINNLVKRYEEDIRPIIECFDGCLEMLTESAGVFADSSRNVQKIRSL